MATSFRLGDRGTPSNSRLVRSAAPGLSQARGSRAGVKAGRRVAVGWSGNADIYIGEGQTLGRRGRSVGRRWLRLRGVGCCVVVDVNVRIGASPIRFGGVRCAVTADGNVYIDGPSERMSLGAWRV